jgi:hypothetical protein
MYRCQQCSRVSAAGTPLHRLVVSTRARKYPFRRDANVIYRLVNGKWKEFKIDDPGGDGNEIAAEIGVCPDCARLTEPASG